MRVILEKRQFATRRFLLTVIWLPWVFIALLRLAPPFTFEQSILPGIAIVLPTLLLWSAIAIAAHEGPMTFAISPSATATTMRLMWVLFFLFILLSYINFFLIESRSLFAIVSDRESSNMLGRSPSIIGGAVAMLTAVPVVFLTCRAILLRPNRIRRSLIIDLTIIIISIPPLIFSGGRNPLVLSVVFYFMASQMFSVKAVRPVNERLFSRRSLLILAGCIIIAGYVMYVAIERRVLQGTLHTYPYILVNHYDVSITPLYYSLEQANVALSVFYANVYYYIQHAMTFLAQMPSREFTTTGGLATFPLYAAALDFVLDLDRINSLETQILFPNVYTTLWGALIQDAGGFGAFIALLVFSAFMFMYVKKGRATLSMLLMLPTILMFILMSPFYALTSTSFGGSLLFVSFIVGLIPRLQIGNVAIPAA